MRYLLHFGLFAFALTVVTQADAQDKRRGDRHTTVVIATAGGPRSGQPVRPSFDHPRAVYDSRRMFPEPPRAVDVAHRAYLAERQDLEQIVSIARRWRRATASRDRYGQWKADQRLHAWLEREIRESIRAPHSHRYTERVRVLSDELAMLERRTYQGPGHHGRSHHGYNAKKARILDELIELSERQVQQARVNVRYPSRRSFAFR